MKENEYIASYFLHVDNIVNTMRGLGEKMKDEKVIQKILRFLPMRFYVKVSTIREAKDLKTLSVYEL